MPEFKLAAKPRTERGNGPAKRLRKQGMIPAVIYGCSKESVSITVDPKDVLKIIHSDTGENTIFEINLEGEKKGKTVRIKDYQLNPLNFDITHADFIYVDMDQYIQVSVPVELIGVPKEVASNEANLDLVLRELEIKCLPGDIPPKIEIQVGNMTIGDNIQVSELEFGDKLEIMNEPSAAVVVLSAVKVETVKTDEGDEEIEGGEPDSGGEPSKEDGKEGDS